MKENKKYGFGTTAIHLGKQKDPYGALVTPIYQTSTFEFENCQDGADKFAMEKPGYVYGRLANPTTSVLEAKIAALEGGEAALATSSGIGAITSVIWTLINAGDHIIADKTLYGCTFSYLNHQITRLGVEVDFIDTADTELLKKTLRPETKIIYLETPANPTLKITDLEKVSGIAHEYNPAIRVICDNTFSSPYNQRPLEHGVDIVVHSATKYLNGHGDVIAGFVVGDAETILNTRVVGVKDMTGSVIGPQEAYYILRGLKTLEIRVKRHNESAGIIAEYLEKHPKVTKVYYPGLESFEGHEIAKKQMDGFGGMISFEVQGDRETTSKFVDSLELCTLAVSLGDAETLVEHPASMTHATYSPEELADAGISEGLVRISVGLENPEDIIDDIEQALAQI